MTPERPAVERRLRAALEASPSRIPVLLGGCGVGRTALLRRVAETHDDLTPHYVDVERAASTPEGFLALVREHSPYVDPAGRRPPVRDARGAFEALLDLFRTARAPGDTPALFLLDEVLELKTFESFPKLRTVVRELIAGLAESPNRFVLSTRYVNRALRLFRDAPDRYELVHVPPLNTVDVAATLERHHVGRDDSERSDLAQVVHALTDGRPVYVRAVAVALAGTDGPRSGDPVSALAGLLGSEGALALQCRFCYELRLHRARGYGALKAILRILAEEEPLTLTEVAQRLHRTPGSTKDYLTWLEDVDLITVQQKRYSFADPLLRLWVRLHCQPTPPTDEDLAREVQEHAVARLPYLDAPPPAVDTPSATEAETAPPERTWSIIEID